MEGFGFTLLHVRGIPISATWSWLLIVAITVWSLATNLFPATYPNLAGSTYLGMGLVAAAAFFASVFLHELGHALTAQREGLRIEGITLWLLGGAARLRNLPASPGEVRVGTTRLPGVAGGVGVGVDTRDLAVDLPFEVRFVERDVRGPSAGLAYALAITDLLSPQDYARGRSVAATGTIDVDGRVGLVGGVEQKAIAADDAGAKLFVVPVAEVDQARGEGLDVIGAPDLARALSSLQVA